MSALQLHLPTHLPEYALHLGVEVLNVPKCRPDDAQHPVLVFLQEASALLRVEIEKGIGDLHQIFLLLALAEHWLELELFYLPADVDESEELNHAPEPGQIRHAAKDDHALATAQKHRQAAEVGLDICLVQAALVEPDARLAALAGLEIVAPSLQRSPLLRRAIAPRVRHEGIAFIEARVDTFREQPRGRGVVRDIALLELVKRDATEACRGVGEDFARRA
mmetsp:Transcript_28759/g.86987  ORF Transcript_28759/g.86987 Transcript_28759/m.86987 type:complete len:221 (-) Transcript_28759:46-708(-)